MRRRLLALLIAAVAALFAAAPASAQEATATPEATPRIDNAAIAVNTEDDSSVFEFAFDIRRVMNGIVDQTNVAVAYSSCENCKTVAIAIRSCW